MYSLEELKRYLEKNYKIPVQKIKLESSLLNDFEIIGDDVDSFFTRLIKDFSIEVQCLDLSRFFRGDEPFDFISPILRFFKGVKTESMPTILVRDIDMLIKTGILK